MDSEEERIKNLTKPRDKAASWDEREFQQKILESEELQLMMETSLTNQLAEKTAVQNLTYENQKLKIHHKDMEVRFVRMQHEYDNLMDDLRQFKETDERHRYEIARLKQDIEELQRTQGGDQNMRDMQDRLIRLSNDHAEKDLRIHKLEELLEGTGGERDINAQQSAVCVML